MSSRECLGSPWLQPQRGRDKVWRGRACQRTRRARQLHENDSRRTVRSVGGDCADGGHHGGEHRGRDSRRRHGKRRAQEGTERAAGCTGTAFLFDDVIALRGCFRAGRSGVVFIGLGCQIMVPGSALFSAVVVRMLGRSGLLGAGCGRAAMVVRTAERHGCDRSTLGGDCQHHQPDQKRSKEQTHVCSLQKGRRPCLER